MYPIATFFVVFSVTYGFVKISSSRLVSVRCINSRGRSLFWTIGNVLPQTFTGWAILLKVSKSIEYIQDCGYWGTAADQSFVCCWCVQELQSSGTNLNDSTFRSWRLNLARRASISAGSVTFFTNVARYNYSNFSTHVICTYYKFVLSEYCSLVKLLTLLWVFCVNMGPQNSIDLHTLRSAAAAQKSKHYEV